MADRDDLWNIAQVRDYMGGVHASTIYRKIKEGVFPPSIKIGPTTARWRRSEVEAAREKMIATQDLTDITSQLKRMSRELAEMQKVAEKQGDAASIAKLQALQASLGIGGGA